MHRIEWRNTEHGNQESEEGRTEGEEVREEGRRSCKGWKERSEFERQLAVRTETIQLKDKAAPRPRTILLSSGAFVRLAECSNLIEPACIVARYSELDARSIELHTKSLR
jgi:hypothetical protein